MRVGAQGSSPTPLEGKPRAASCPRLSVQAVRLPCLRATKPVIRHERRISVPTSIQHIHDTTDTPYVQIASCVYLNSRSISSIIKERSSVLLRSVSILFLNNSAFFFSSEERLVFAGFSAALL